MNTLAMPSLPPIADGDAYVASLAAFRKEGWSYVLLPEAPVPMTLDMRSLYLLTSYKTQQVTDELCRAQGIHDGIIYDFHQNAMFFSNGDEHNRRRGALNEHFAAGAIANMKSEVSRLAQSMVSAEVGAGNQTMDLASFSRRYAVEVMNLALGLNFKWCAEASTQLLAAQLATGFLPPLSRSTVETGLASFFRWCRDTIDEQDVYERPWDVKVLETLDREFRMNSDRAAWQLLSIILSAVEPMSFALSMGLTELLKHRAQWQQVVAGENLSGAVYEMLRFHPPISAIPRVVVEPFHHNGVDLDAGQLIALSVIGATRDPNHFNDPHVFDINRGAYDGFVSFGWGPHRCLGEHLAMLAIEEFVQAVALYAPDAHTISSVQHKPGIMRRVTECEIELWRS